MDDQEATPKVTQLSEEELQILRSMVKSEKNMRWLWASIRNAAGGIVVVLTALALAYSALEATILRIVTK